MWSLVFGLCGLTLAACTEKPAATGNPIAHVDHVIVGTANLAAGINQLERLTGVRPVLGGSHPGRGTRNALMSLGDGTYLELLAPDPAQSVDNAEIAELESLTKLTPLGWAVSGASEADLRRALLDSGTSLSPSDPGSRKKPDGTLLRWSTFGYEANDDPLAPFFIFWSDPALHPSHTSPGGCSLGGVSIHHPAADQLRTAIAPLALGIEMSRAPAGSMTITLRCNGREVTLG